MSEVTLLLAGPLFRAALLIVLIGLARRFVVSTLPALRAGTGLAGGGSVLRSALSARGLIGTTTLVSSLLVFLLVAEHLALLGGPGLPALAPPVADALAWAALGGLAGFALAGRIQDPARTPSRRWRVFFALLAASLVTGLLARHPQVSPIAWRPTLLLHMLFGEAALVLVPFLGVRRTEVPTCAPSCTM